MKTYSLQEGIPVIWEERNKIQFTTDANEFIPQDTDELFCRLATIAKTNEFTIIIHQTLDGKKLADKDITFTTIEVATTIEYLKTLYTAKEWILNEE